jgi:hypothetical protein
MANELQKKPWKVWMSSAPDPTAVLASAYDLLNGVSLGHDIIIYNGNVYSNTKFSGTSWDDFYRYEIDVSPAIFDKRSKFKVETITTQNFLKLEKPSSIKVYYYDKDAALYPEDIKSFFSVNSSWQEYFRYSSTFSTDTLEFGYSSNDFMSCVSSTIDDFSNIYADIILYKKDTTFSNTMSFEDNKEAFTKIKLNTSSETVQKLIVGAVFFNSDTSLPEYDNNYYSQVFSYLLNNCSDLLKHIYFWVKAPFCADYIDPEDFNQDLNQDADVIHRNLLLSNNYDGVRNNFNRYTESYSSNYNDATISDYIERLSRPYVPTNSPLKDFLSEKLGQSVGADLQNVSAAAQALIENSYEDDHIIGSVLTVPGSEEESPDQSTTRYTPFNFYDPESREEKEYYTSLGRIPTLIGCDGNLVTDGRLMSPSIDEIWYIIKKLISGQPAASYARDSDNVSSPYSEHATSSTTLTEAVNAQYNIDHVSLDPIDFEYTTDSNGDVSGINIKEFTVQPEKVEHHIYSLLKVVSSRINSFYEQQNEIDSTLSESKEGTVYNGNSRDIARTGEGLILGTTKMAQSSLANNEYGPRSSAPLSLRELEAAILGNKYNIENNFMFISKTYAVTGKFGKQIEDENKNIISAGSLYQFHRDYNADIENPNTYFKIGATDDNGRDATFSDLDGQVEKINSIDVYLLDKHNRRTDKIKQGTMPLLVENYGKSALLEAEQGFYTGADVYMAADGTWRYKAEHMRLPILRSRY